jgi:hypothetical protein
LPEHLDEIQLGAGKIGEVGRGGLFGTGAHGLSSVRVSSVALRALFGYSELFCYESSNDVTLDAVPGPVKSGSRMVAPTKGKDLR